MAPVKPPVMAAAPTAPATPPTAMPPVTAPVKPPVAAQPAPQPVKPAVAMVPSAERKAYEARVRDLEVQEHSRRQQARKAADAARKAATFDFGI